MPNQTGAPKIFLTRKVSVGNRGKVTGKVFQTSNLLSTDLFLSGWFPFRASLVDSGTWFLGNSAPAELQSLPGDLLPAGSDPIVPLACSTGRGSSGIRLLLAYWCSSVSDRTISLPPSHSGRNFASEWSRKCSDWGCFTPHNLLQTTARILCQTRPSF